MTRTGHSWKAVAAGVDVFVPGWRVNGVRWGLTWACTWGWSGYASRGAARLDGRSSGNEERKWKDGEWRQELAKHFFRFQAEGNCKRGRDNRLGINGAAETFYTCISGFKGTYAYFRVPKILDLSPLPKYAREAEEIRDLKKER